MNSVGDEGGRTGQFYDPHGIALSKDSKVFSQNGRYPKLLLHYLYQGVSMWTMTLPMLLVGGSHCVCVPHIWSIHHTEGQRKDTWNTNMGSQLTRMGSCMTVIL